MKPVDLRCENKLHGVLSEGIVEVKCNSRFCGARAGAIVLHRWSVADGSLIDTKRYKDQTEEVKARGTSRIRSAIRTA